jgi:hypothetical protein
MDILGNFIIFPRNTYLSITKINPHAQDGKYKAPRFKRGAFANKLSAQSPAISA